MKFVNYLNQFLIIFVIIINYRIIKKKVWGLIYTTKTHIPITMIQYSIHAQSKDTYPGYQNQPLVVFDIQ